MITEVPGIRVGHCTDEGARTGCTVVLGERPLVASGEVRGSAPATREFALLDPAATVRSIDAVVMSGGSAFGLAAGDGVMSWLAAVGRGFPTPWGSVPIVVGMSLFDLSVGDPSVRPLAGDGWAAAEAAAGDGGTLTELGPVGAGTGATVSKWRGEQELVDSGLGGAVLRDGALVVAALVAVNSWGDVAGSSQAGRTPPEMPGPGLGSEAGEVGNTTIGVVATNAAIDQLGCLHMARGAHDGLARSISPPHGSLDGDAFVAVTTGEVPAAQDMLRWMSVQVVEAAIRSVGST